jgi:hypothetical protein
VSTSAGTPPEQGNGAPPAPARPRRDLRDRLWGKALILAVLLTFTLLVSKTCAANRDDITQDEAVELAMEEASFVPCEAQICRQVRYLNQGLPPVGYWGVVLSKQIDANGRPTRTESFLVNATTGEVTRKQ